MHGALRYARGTLIGAGSRSAPPLAARLALAALIVSLGCSRPAPASRSESPAPGPPIPTAIEAEPPAPREVELCDRAIPVYEGGRQVRTACADELGAQGLTVVDLSNNFAPHLWEEAPELGAKGRVPFRDTLIALENDKLGAGPEFDRARQDKYLELYGIFPSPSVVRARLLDDERHRCHEAVDDALLEQLGRALDPWRELPTQRSEKAFAKTLGAKLEAARQHAGVRTIDELRGDPNLKTTFAQWDRVGVAVGAVRAAQRHLRCERILGPRSGEEGVIDYATSDALKTFQRKHMIVSWQLDLETRDALHTSSREMDFRALLRSLRERVVDASGLIEDGTARGEPGEVVGRVLDTEAFRALASRGPLEGGAPDLVAAATDAAAKALGWTSPEAARAFFEAADPAQLANLVVAVKLPAPPRWHSHEMALRAEIDRGDVWYDFPFTKHGDPKGQEVARRPTLVLYAKDGDRDVALVRWPTTIGGWKPEKTGKRKVQLAYKESPEGPRVWRDLVVAPAWIPPESAPRRDLVRPRPGGGWATRDDLFGPGYASAYGLVMLIHHRVGQIKGAKDPFFDQGIRSHGSVSYDTIHHGTSHGCHRLFNHQAIRLAEFLLAHRKSVRRGPIEVGYGRSFAWEGKPMKLAFDSRGYRFELDPPVPVEVLRGRVMGKHAGPILEPQDLPESMADRFKQEMFED